MANRYPLILDSNSNRIKELPSGDNLDLTGAGISSVSSVSVGTAVTIGTYGIHVTGVVTATSFVGNGADLTGVGSTDNIQTSTDSRFLANVNITGVTTSSGGFVGALTGNVTGTASTATLANTATVATNAQGLTGTPSISVNVLTGASANFSGNVSIAGTLTYDDVESIESLGIGTFRSGINIGSLAGIAATLSPNGDAKFVGVITALGMLATGVVTATDFNATSDTTVKENIEVIQNSLDSIVRIDGVTFRWKDSQRESAGVTAQNVENILPHLVNGGDLKSVNYNGLIGYLIEAIKSQQSQIQELTSRIKALESLS